MVTTMALDSTFFGIFTTKGELEAVESTLDAATVTACNLSPGKGGKAPLAPIGRTVEPVTIVRGDIGEALALLLAAASDKVVAGALAEYETQVKKCTVYADGKPPVVIGNNAYFAAKAKLFAALSVYEGIVLQ